MNEKIFIIKKIVSFNDLQMYFFYSNRLSILLPSCSKNNYVYLTVPTFLRLPFKIRLLYLSNKWCLFFYLNNNNPIIGYPLKSSKPLKTIKKLIDACFLKIDFYIFLNNIKLTKLQNSSCEFRNRL